MREEREKFLVFPATRFLRQPERSFKLPDGLKKVLDVSQHRCSSYNRFFNHK